MADPKKNTAFTFAIGLVAQASRPSFKAAPTLAAGDFKVSIDGGAFANLTNLPTVTPAGGTRVQIALTAAEMNGDNILVQCIDAAGAEWDDVLVTFDLAVSSTDDLATQASVNTIAGYVDTEVAAIKAKTDLIPAAPAAVGDVPTATQNADALLKRDMSAVTGESARSPLNALRFIRNKWSVTGGTLTVTKEDDATEAWTAAVTSSASADPITGSDPT